MLSQLAMWLRTLQKGTFSILLPLVFVCIEIHTNRFITLEHFGREGRDFPPLKRKQDTYIQIAVSKGKISQMNAFMFVRNKWIASCELLQEAACNNSFIELILNSGVCFSFKMSSKQTETCQNSKKIPNELENPSINMKGIEKHFGILSFNFQTFFSSTVRITVDFYTRYIQCGTEVQLINLLVLLKMRIQFEMKIPVRKRFMNLLKCINWCQVSAKYIQIRRNSKILIINDGFTITIILTKMCVLVLQKTHLFSVSV
eukprot:TRINITY_DN10153_c0_g1_i12.p1 TRINITY_DN10153_c0_g1~~TRINITY_DN10153_c0_g1_i12.p1  ORF type:complete len:258 (+),score=-4.70 TRINITY_DN10153_c0_g1_i12:702-1475(+)